MSRVGRAARGEPLVSARGHEIRFTIAFGVRALGARDRLRY